MACNFLGNNEGLKYTLCELSASDEDQIEHGVFEVIGDGDSPTDLSIPDIARAALQRIESLEKAIDDTIGFVESTGGDEESIRMLRAVR